MTSDTRSEINDSEDDFIEIGSSEEITTGVLLPETPGSVSLSSCELSTPSQKRKKKKQQGEGIDFDPFLQIEE